MKLELLAPLTHLPRVVTVGHDEQSLGDLRPKRLFAETRLTKSQPAIEVRLHEFEALERSDRWSDVAAHAAGVRAGTSDQPSWGQARNKVVALLPGTRR